MAEAVTDVTYKKLFIRFPQKVPPEEEVKKLSPYIVRVSYPRQKRARFCHIVLENQSVVAEVLKQLNEKEYKNGHLRVEKPRKLKYLKNEQDSHISEEKKTFKEARSRNLHKLNNELCAGDGNSTMPQTEADDSTQFTAGKYVRRRRSGKPATGGDNDRRLWITKLPLKIEDKELIATFPGCIWTKVYRSKASKSSRAICKFTTAQQAAAILVDPSKHQFKGKKVAVALAKSQQLRGSGMKKNGLKTENSGMDIEGEQLKAESQTENETAAVLKDSESNSEEAMDAEEDDEMPDSGDDTNDLAVNSNKEDND